MTLLDRDDRRPVHFMGIAGAGMSGLAELFTRRGVTVTGCDAHLGDATDLRRLGIPLFDGHDPAHLVGARAVVVTSAVSRDHPELVQARALSVPVVRRAEALGEAVSGGQLLAIAGTHGKTTTTVMTTEALEAATLNPTGVVGGRVASWEGNLRFGGDRLFVVEADEYDRSFLALTPGIAVITNVEADHLDIYDDLADITTTFEQFAEPARIVVRCADDPGAAALSLSSAADIIDYGLSPAARLRATDVRSADGGSQFSVHFDGHLLGEVALRVPGRHNVQNALAAIGSGLALGATIEPLALGLARFGGVQRRFQRLGEEGGVLVVDDYAHHPTEIAATLAAARASYSGRRLVAAFQPHLYSRTRDFATEFGTALAGADLIFLTDIYPAREQPIAGVSSALIERAIRTAGAEAAWTGARLELADALAGALQPGDIVILLGAGDITLSGPDLLRRLAATP